MLRIFRRIISSEPLKKINKPTIYYFIKKILPSISLDLVYLNLFFSILCISRNFYIDKRYASLTARQGSVNDLSATLRPINWVLSGG